MNIYSPKGTKVVYTAKGGYPCQVDRANEYLTIGETYEVDHIDVWSWHSDVYLVGFDKGFNTTLFGEYYEPTN